jgi:hypothetical protein
VSQVDEEFIKTIINSQLDQQDISNKIVLRHKVMKSSSKNISNRRFDQKRISIIIVPFHMGMKSS